VKVENRKKDLPLTRASPWFDQQSQRLGKWEEVKRVRKETRSEFYGELGPRLSLLGRWSWRCYRKRKTRASAQDTLLQVAIIKHELPALAVFGLLRAIAAFCW
jgi:hypothetical protein